MRLRLTLLLYNLLLPLALLILVPVMAVETKRRGGRAALFWQRFGFFRREVKLRLLSQRGRAWWINAGSVGEVNVAAKLIAEILRREPDRPLVLSVTTSTGYAVAVKDAPPTLTVIQSPLDCGWIARRMLTLIRPQRYILMEAELWPNLVRRAQKRGVPVILANARLSPRSKRRYRRWRWLAGPVFSMLDRVLVQDESDIPRWAGIGVPQERIAVTGSIKYDLATTSAGERAGEFRSLLRQLWGDPLPPVLLAASTHEGEEKALAAVFMEVRRDYPSLVLMVAPRHFERRAEVADDLASHGLAVALRSELDRAGFRPDALIIDSTGELRDWQALATVVLTGKSFLATGGQNPAEAIAAGVPVITGPHMENFLPLMKLLQSAGGITQVASIDTLAAAIRQCLADPAAAAAVAGRGRQALESHRGAAARTVDAITAPARSLAHSNASR